MSNTVVVILMVVLTSLIIGWDIWLAVDGKDGNTISERMKALETWFPFFKYLVIFGMGLVIGHWYW